MMPTRVSSATREVSNAFQNSGKGKNENTAASLSGLWPPARDPFYNQPLLDTARQRATALKACYNRRRFERHLHLRKRGMIYDRANRST
jgi:hypothetical protein